MSKLVQQFKSYRLLKFSTKQPPEITILTFAIWKKILVVHYPGWTVGSATEKVLWPKLFCGSVICWVTHQSGQEVSTLISHPIAKQCHKQQIMYVFVWTKTDKAEDSERKIVPIADTMWYALECHYDPKLNCEQVYCGTHPRLQCQDGYGRFLSII